MLQILNDFPHVEVPGGVQVQLGDAYGEERRRVVFSLHVPRLAELGVKKVAEVVVRYVSVGDSVEAHTLTLPIAVNLVSADAAAVGGVDAEVTEEVVILMSARAKEEARKMADQGDFDGAKEHLRHAAEDLRKTAAGSAHAEELLAHAETLEGHSRTLAPESYLLERKHMSYENHTTRQRKWRPEGS